MFRSLAILLLTMTTVALYAQQAIDLRGALQRARQHNPDLRVLQQDISAARADRTTAAIKPNPVLNMQLLHMANPVDQAPGTNFFNAQNTQYWYQVTKPFQVAGQRHNKIELADKAVERSQFDYEEAARNVYRDAASSWIDVWAAQVNLNILLEGKRNIDSLVLINTYRLKNKVITDTDLDRTQLLAEQYNRDIVTARQSLLNELQALRYLLGTADSVFIALDDPTFQSITLPVDSLLASGTERRSDILSARKTIEVNQTNISLQKSLAYPQPELGAVYNPQNTTPYLGLYGTVEIPLFNRNQGQREKAQVLELRAEQNLLATERQAEAEVTAAYRTYVTQRANLSGYQQNLEKSARILNSVRYSYLKGATSVIDYLEAQRSWLDTQQRYYATMEVFRRSYVNLLYATGMINQLAEQ
ncbi:MAG TPA: TolC family protein [Chryseolinea sp.]|nr:TolC family protein [Chryseolinea sp.]